MKKMKRLPAILLALVLLAGIVSCGTKETPENSTTGVEETTSKAPASDSPVEEQLEVPEGLDYDDAEFRILARNQSDYYCDELWVEAAGSDKVDAAVFSRTKQIEENYHVTMKMDTLNHEGNIDPWMTVSSLVAGPDDIYHLVATHGRNCASYAVQDLSADWYLLPYVNLDASWWSRDAQEQWTALSGSIYMMTGDISYLSVGQAVGTFFNKTLLQDAGMEFPYQLVRDGEWTYETFHEYVNEVSDTMNGDGTGNITTDSTGYAVGWWRGPMNIIYSTGSRWLNVTEDDITVVGPTENSLTDAFDSYFDFLFESGNCIMIGGDYGNTQKAFVANRVAFYDEITLRAIDFNREGASFGLVPMPKYSENVDKNYTFVNAATNIFVVPKNVLGDATATQMASAVIETMAYIGGKTVLPTYYEDLLTVRSMTDVESVEMMGIIRNSLTFDLGYFYNIKGFCDIGYYLAGHKGENFTTQYSSLVGTVDSALQDWKDLK